MRLQGKANAQALHSTQNQNHQQNQSTYSMHAKQVVMYLCIYVFMYLCINIVKNLKMSKDS